MKDHSSFHQNSLLLNSLHFFENIFDQLSMNNRFEEAEFEPEPTFEKTINEIKNNHLKSIASDYMNLSAIISLTRKLTRLV